MLSAICNPERSAIFRSAKDHASRRTPALYAPSHTPRGILAVAAIPHSRGAPFLAAFARSGDFGFVQDRPSPRLKCSEKLHASKFRHSRREHAQNGKSRVWRAHPRPRPALARARALTGDHPIAQLIGKPREKAHNADRLLGRHKGGLHGAYQSKPSSAGWSVSWRCD